MGEYAHIQRQIAKIEAEERAMLDELILASQQLITRVKLDLMPDRHMGWGGGVIERLEAALATIDARMIASRPPPRR